MSDISRLMQDAAILEVIDKSADEASSLSAQNSYQAMRIEELERDLAARDAELASYKQECYDTKKDLVKTIQRAEAAEREKERILRDYGQLCDAHIADRDEWKRKAEEAARDALRYRWLRDDSDLGRTPWITDGLDGNGAATVLEMAVADAAIDAAIEKARDAK